MKLDKVGVNSGSSPSEWSTTEQADLYPQDNSGTIEREEFLSLPQVNSNPLATRYLLHAALTNLSPLP